MPLIIKVLQPEHFNAETMLLFAWPMWAKCAPYSQFDPETRQAALDAFQRALDGCVNAGILGE